MISIREIKNVPDGYVLPVFWREWLAVVGYLFYTRAFPFLSSCEFAVPSNLVSYRNKRNALCELDYLLNSILSPLVTTFRKNNNLCYTAPLVLRPRNSTLVLYNRSTKSYQFSNTVYIVSPMGFRYILYNLFFCIAFQSLIMCIESKAGQRQSTKSKYLKKETMCMNFVLNL